MQPADTVAAKAARIRQTLNNLCVEEKKCYIYKVHDHLRNLNPSAYEPQILAIGPYHHGKGNTMQMENHKWLYMKSLIGHQSVDLYVSAIEDIKQEALICYANDMENCNHDEFANMMLLDGCFIIELLRKCKIGYTQGDPIFETQWMLNSIQRDLMLFENQIPLFVLYKLFDLFQASVSDFNDLFDLIIFFFKGRFPVSGSGAGTIINAGGTKHLLHLIHKCLTPASSDTSHEKTFRLDRSVTKLRDANVEFEKNNEGASLFNITFTNGTLKLPHLVIGDRAEVIFRNLIAYEQYFSMREQHFVTDFVAFLDCIIDSPGDVEILRQHGILENWLGSDEAVSNTINKLTDSVTGGRTFSYAGVCDDMDKYCKKRYNRWMAVLRRNHLSSPWAILSIIAAVILLLLTIVQTLCSVLQFRTSSN